MATVAQDVAAIRTAVYGRDVREAIADGIENCYSDVSRAKTLADQAVADATQANNTAAQGVNNLSQTIADANTATQRANDAASAANTAKNDADAATAAANQAVQNLTGQVNDAIAALPGAVNDAVDEETQKFARIDGYYKDMTVGDSEQLISSQFAKDKAIYAFRKAGGTKDIGNRAYLDKIVGGTVCWNQISSPNNYSANKTQNNCTFTKQDDNSIKVVVSDTVATVTRFTVAKVIFIQDHKYLLTIGDNYGLDKANLAVANDAYGSIGVGKNGLYSTIWNATDITSWDTVGISIRVGCVAGTYIFRPQIFDLTQMFGSAIADYIYSLEQATTGAGVAWFRKLFPNDYYEYNAGKLISVNALSHDTVGFNLWDEEWENGVYDENGAKAGNPNRIRSKNKIPVFGETAYNITKPAGRFCVVCEYDSNGLFIKRTSTTASQQSSNNYIYVTDAKAAYLAFHIGSDSAVTTYTNGICINLSHSGYRNGEHEAYEKHSYPMADIDLRGILKLDENNELYYDGDEYLPEGKVNRKYGIVDLGTVDWVYCSGANQLAFSASVGAAKPTAQNVPSNVICSKYKTVDTITYSAWSTRPDKSVFLSTSEKLLVIRDEDYTDAATFKAAMSGVMLVYELETPTEEEADPFTQVQVVDDFGTEEFVTGNPLPVYAETSYPINLRDKLQHLPDLAAANGDYMIQQSGSKMTLVPSKVPQAPTANGTYVLKVTVSGGTPTYKWEAAT